MWKTRDWGGACKGETCGEQTEIISVKGKERYSVGRETKNDYRDHELRTADAIGEKRYCNYVTSWSGHGGRFRFVLGRTILCDNKNMYIYQTAKLVEEKHNNKKKNKQTSFPSRKGRDHLPIYYITNSLPTDSTLPYLTFHTAPLRDSNKPYVCLVCMYVSLMHFSRSWRGGK